MKTNKEKFFPIPQTLYPTPKCIIYAFLLATSIFADTLYLKDGQEIKDAVVTEINDNEVKYKISDRQVVYTTKKSNVLMILYENGTKDVFGSEIEEPIAKVDNVYQAEGNETEKESVANEKKNRYGVRGAYNSYVSNVQYAEKMIGRGFAVGLITIVPKILPIISLKSEINFLYRYLLLEFYNDNNRHAPYYFVADDLVISALTLIYETPFGKSFYLEAGFQTDITFAKLNNNDSFLNNVNLSRSAIDFSLAFGLGWNFNERWGVGLRSAIGLTDFTSDLSGRLTQVDIGVNYLF